MGFCRFKMSYDTQVSGNFFAVSSGFQNRGSVMKTTRISIEIQACPQDMLHGDPQEKF